MLSENSLVFLAIQKGTVLTEGSRNIERSKLIGGHSAGGLEGLKMKQEKKYSTIFRNP